MSIAAIVAEAATALEALFDQTCTVGTPGTATADGMGGWTDGTPTTVTGIKCRIEAPSGADQQVAQRLGTVIDTTIRLKLGTVVTSSCTITAEATGNAYTVGFTNADESDRTMVRCGCRRVE